MTNTYRPVAAMIVKRNFADQQTRYLVVKKPRQNNAWQFPQGGVDAGETLLSAARRELIEECGPYLQVEITSNESIGSYQYDFPADFKRSDHDHIGAEVSFFEAQWISGEAVVDGLELVGSVWLTSQELQDVLSPTYYLQISPLIGLSS